MMNIWIDGDKNKRIEIAEKVKNHDDESEPVFELKEMDEFYIQDDGSICGFINGKDGVGVGIDIPFGIWFYEFLRLDSFKTFEKFLTKNEEAVNAVKLLIKKEADK